MIRCLITFAVVSSLASRVAAAEAVDFETRVLPIFATHCVKCHGPDKASGKLRLDTAAELTATAKPSLLGGDDNDQSELLIRITLPDGDRKKMPKGAPSLPADEIATLREWIEGGASLVSAEKPTDQASNDDAADTAEATADVSPRLTPGEEDPALANLRPASAEAIAAIEAAGGSVMPLFGDSPLLQVSFAQSPPADESALAALNGAADNIVWLNLSKAQISLAGAKQLGKLKNLIQLHLEHSTIDDAGAAELAGLPRLEYVNLYGTSVTDAGVAPLSALAKLRHLYVWQTKVSWDAAQQLEKAVPGLQVNLGWDHPQVVKLRVEKELDAARKIAETATTQAAELQQRLTAANQSKEQAEARVKELQSQLEALEQPAADAAPAVENAGRKDDAPADNKDDST